MLNNEWKEVRLGDVIEFNPKETIKKGTILKKVGMEMLIPFQREIAGFEIAEYSGGSKFRKGDTLLARITPCLENGKTAQVTILDNNEIGFGSTEFIVLREKENLTINDFIYYLAISPIIREVAIKSMTGTSGRQRVQIDAIENILYELPPLKEQKAIAHILSTLDEKIEVNNQINKTLENIAQTIFKHWFIDFEFPNENGEPYKSSGGEMVESELGMIPKGWKVKTISDMELIVTDYVANGSFKALKENVTLYDEYNYAAFIRNTDFKCNFNSGMKYVDKHSYDFLKKSRLYGGEVIISNVGDVGSVYLCPYFDMPMTLGNNLIMIKDKKNKTWNYFIYRLFKSREGQGMLDSITGGSVQLKFNKTDFRNLKIVVPSEVFINRYMKVFVSIEEYILFNNKQNSKLADFRDTLLPKLMSGEVKVSLDSEGSR